MFYLQFYGIVVALVTAVFILAVPIGWVAMLFLGVLGFHVSFGDAWFWSLAGSTWLVFFGDDFMKKQLGDG